MRDWNSKEIAQFIEFLIAEKILQVSLGQLPTIFVSEKGKSVLMGNIKVLRKKAIAIQKIQDDYPLFEELRVLRKQIAEQENVPPFVVFSDKTLKEMCEVLPTTEQAFLTVSGVGQMKLEKYGDIFIQLFKKHANI